MKLSKCLDNKYRSCQHSRLQECTPIPISSQQRSLATYHPRSLLSTESILDHTLNPPATRSIRMVQAEVAEKVASEYVLAIESQPGLLATWLPLAHGHILIGCVS